MEKQKVFSIISTVAIFLLFEVLTFVSFGLSNSYIVYAFLGLFVLILLVVAHFQSLKGEGLTNLLIFIIPILLFSLINALSSLNTATHTSILLRILIPLGLMSFATLGYLSSLGNGFKISTAIILIYGGLALITLISYFATMIQYVPFYTLIYGNSYIYYDGAKSSLPIGQTAYFLMGFSIREVTVDYFSLYPSVLSTSVIALLFISPKEQTKKFVLFAVYAFIGIFALITMPTRMMILTDVLIAISLVVIILFFKGKIKSKVIKTTLLVLSVLFLIAFLILFINAQSSLSAFAWLRNIIESVPLFNRIFNTNRLVSRYNTILDGCLNFGAWLGFMPDTQFSAALHYDFLTNSILFDTILFSGFFGLVLFIVIMVILVKRIIKYVQVSNDEVMIKSLVIAFLLVFFGYSLINYDSQPYVYYSDLIPYYQHGLFLVCLFLYGYVYFKSFPAKVITKEEIIEDSNLVEEEAKVDEEQNN
ncbi:MAG: hypothetical protein IJQ67_01655 [Bacilli bacterium]|nr:hypothetical protein [Bacilli bacterium]